MTLHHDLHEGNVRGMSRKKPWVPGLETSSSCNAAVKMTDPGYFIGGIAKPLWQGEMKVDKWGA